MIVKKTIRYIILFVLIGFVGYKSVYIKKLDTIQSSTEEKFEASVFTQKLWETSLPNRLDSAVALTKLIAEVNLAPTKALEHYTYAMAIGNYRYALVSFHAQVKEIHEDDCLVEAEGVGSVKLATEFIYGNAIRDASNLLQLKDFPNSADLNSVSEALNKIVRTTVLPSFKKDVQVGDHLSIIGAIEINQAHLNWKELEVIPVRLQIQP